MEDKKATILIVEDEILIAHYMKRILEGMDLTVYPPVGTGSEAVEAAEKMKPDIVLMDIRLPGEMDGIDAANEIGTRFHMPIVFITGYKEKEIINRALQLKPVAILDKPMKPLEVKNVISQALAH